MGKRIKSKGTKTNKIKVPTSSNIELNYPVFCFKHLQPTPQKDHKFYSDFIQRLRMLCNLTWDQINTSAKHGLGTEKMPVGSIKPDLPLFVSPDVTHLTVFRANGDNRPFLGLRRNHVFHVIFIEEKFNDIYNH